MSWERALKGDAPVHDGVAIASEVKSVVRLRRNVVLGTVQYRNGVGT